ncbi:hypothetical protein C884_00695 [Kocuria palustris PEL]|uniref:Uncharacterized protein n=1 Tax=Kocuria palustris PEL TaxID=1236550 RepID=M2XAV3_9MICC|nr:hypothetical protein C884_00695 [Kocuria palustris PEL]
MGRPCTAAAPILPGEPAAHRNRGSTGSGTVRLRPSACCLFPGPCARLGP